MPLWGDECSGGGWGTLQQTRWPCRGWGFWREQGAVVRDRVSEVGRESLRKVGVLQGQCGRLKGSVGAGGHCWTLLGAPWWAGGFALS